MAGWDDDRDKRPFPDGDDEDLFVWGELRPPSRPAWRDGRAAPPRPDPDRTAAHRPARPRAWQDGDEAGGFEVPTGQPRPADARRDTRYGADDEWQEWLDPGEGARAGRPVPGEGPGGPFGPDALGPLPERARPRRRRASAGAVLVAMLLGFLVRRPARCGGDPEARAGRGARRPALRCSSPCSSPSWP